MSEINATISRLNDEIGIFKGKLMDLTSKRQHLQMLLEAGGRAKEIQEAEKQLDELERQVDKEKCKIYDAYRVVVEAVKNLEDLRIKVRCITKRFPEVRFVTVEIPADVKKFSNGYAVPASWAKL